MPARPGRPTRLALVVAGGAALLFAAAAAWLGLQYFNARAEADLLRDQHALAELVLKTARQQLEAERILGAQQLRELQQQLGGVRRAPGRSSNLREIKIALLTPSRPGSAAGTALLAWSPETREGIVAFAGSFAPTENQRLVLWGLPSLPDTAPVRGAVLDFKASGDTRVYFHAPALTQDVRAFAVSRERAGTPEPPTRPGDVILQGDAR